MSSPAATVRAFAGRHGLWHPRLRVLAAVSGGSDSVAMAFVLRELAAAGDFQLAGVSHVNHHVRGAASDGDEAFCRALAARLEVPVVIAHADVPALAREHRQSIEVAGRHARHRALEAAAAELGADRIATAHTRNDQAETVLLHLMRGAGLSGASGIDPSPGVLIRPLLDCPRDDLRTWLAALGEPWREDETNDDVSNPRNRLRHVVLPELRQHFNPAVDAALARFADIFREDHAYLTAAAADAAARLVERRDDGVAIDAPGLLALPRALARRVVRAALETAGVRQSYDLMEVDAVLQSCGGGPGVRRDLPGVRMERSGHFVVLVHRQMRGTTTSEGFRYVLPVPGEVSIEASGAVLEAAGPFDSGDIGLAQGRPFDAHDVQGGDGPFDAARLQGRAQDGADRVVIHADELGDGLLVRSRQAGDRVRVRNVGRKKLQDLFVDRKVDREARDLVPIVTDTSGRIIWVAGHALADEFRVGPLTSKVVILTLRLRNSAGRHR